ncbi:DUF6111 family protein [Marinimicrococcus flavescens]|uniref:DUF6111 family protein n=1 Tax=Marinimicrococcus flavescens TaxID=3031815 RepID=A0AAP3XRM6_9PROT|nr:DUF6111 family protein [Marinimicrococcus flavescens]
MGRAALQSLIAFFAPFLAFLVYRMLMQRGQSFLRDTPWFLLTAIGLVLTSLSFVALALFTGEPGYRPYTPPHLEDGVVVPGRFGEPQ